MDIHLMRLIRKQRKDLEILLESRFILLHS